MEHLAQVVTSDSLINKEKGKGVMFFPFPTKYGVFLNLGRMHASKGEG
jgi:hypothetical protein